MKIFWISKLVLFLPPSLTFQCGFPGLWGLVKERSNTIYICINAWNRYIYLMGHWELISRWLESGGKRKPLSKHWMLFSLWMCSWSWSQPGMVPWEVSGCGCSPSPALAALHSPADGFVTFLHCLGVDTPDETVSAAPGVAVSPEPGGAAPCSFHGIPEFGHRSSPRVLQAAGIPGSCSHWEKGKNRANVRERFPSTTPSPYQALPKPD